MSCVPLPVFALDREILQDLNLDLAVLVEELHLHVDK